MPHERLKVGILRGARDELARLRRNGYGGWSKEHIIILSNNLGVLISCPEQLTAEEHKDVVAGVKSALWQMLAGRVELRRQLKDHGRLSITKAFEHERNLLWEIIDKKHRPDSDEVIEAFNFCTLIHTSMKNVLNKRERPKVDA